MTSPKAPGSFRDPAGFIFHRDGKPHRYVDRRHATSYDQLLSSGLYERLVRDGLLIPHEEVSAEIAGYPLPHKVLRPEVIPFISYPWEWCFSELKAAASLTLVLAKAALSAGMVLRDASAYNVQFRGTSPIFIDTLSFGTRIPGDPWPSYRQFCQHFLAPLALMARRDIRLGELLRLHMDGIPLDLATRLLPFRDCLRPSLAVHIGFHARFLRKSAGDSRARTARVSDKGLMALLENLESTVSALDWNPSGTEWFNYYDNTNYTESALSDKARIIDHFLEKIRPTSIWDVGANTGRLTRLGSKRGIPSVAFDLDPAAVELGFRESESTGSRHLLHLVQDLTNPSSQAGWANEERMSLEARGPAGCVLALGLLHHLAIGNNVPLDEILGYLSRLAATAIIEFIPKSDTQVVKMLAAREDIFSDYSESGFEKAAAGFFRIASREPVQGSERILYLLAEH